MPLLQQLRQVRVVPVAIDSQRDLAEPAGVDQAGVAEPVGIDHRPLFGQCRDQAQVGLVAGGKDEGGLRALKSRQAFLEFAVRAQVSGYQA